MTDEVLPALLRLVLPDLADRFDVTNEHLLLKSFLQPLDLGLGEIQEIAAAVVCLFIDEG